MANPPRFLGRVALLNRVDRGFDPRVPVEGADPAGTELHGSEYDLDEGGRHVGLERETRVGKGHQSVILNGED